MNILQIVSSLHIGGEERVVYKIAECVNPDMYHTSVLCTKEEGIIAEKLVEKGIEVFSPPKGEKNILNYFKYINSIIIQSKCDIIHSHGIALVDLAPLYILKKMPPLVHTFHFGNYPHIKKSYLYTERLMALYAHKLIAVSNHQRSMVIQHHKVNPNKISTIWNGTEVNPYVHDKDVLDEVRKEFQFQEDDIIIGVVAVLSRQKGIETLLDAARQVVQKISNLKFLIVGGGPLENVLKEKAKQLNLDDIVTFTGWRDDAVKLIPIFDIFILPSLWEGLPVVLLEAMAAERAIIVTDVGDNKVLIGDDERGILVPPEDSASIRNAILKIIDDKDLSKRLSQNALLYYQNNLTTDIMVKHYENVYRGLQPKE